MAKRPAPPPSLPPGIDRRGFLRTTTGGAAALLVASVLPAGCAADYPQAAEDGATLRSLTPKQYATTRSVAEAMLVDVPVAPAAIAADMDREMERVGDPVAHDLKVVLALIENLTFFSGHVRPFSSLSIEDRRGTLHGWATSRFNLRRGAYQALKAFVMFYAYSSDSTRPLTHFPGPWPERFKLPATPIDFGEVT